MSLSQSELVALAYGAVFLVVLLYVAIIAAKLVRLERETLDLVELARRRPQSLRDEVESARVSSEA